MESAVFVVEVVHGCVITDQLLVVGRFIARVRPYPGVKSPYFEPEPPLSCAFQWASCPATSAGAVEPALLKAARALATPNTLYTSPARPGRTFSNSAGAKSARRQRRCSHS